MGKHLFIFSKQVWLGQGTIVLSSIEEPLKFYMKWKIEPKESQKMVECSQEIQIVGLSEVVHNQFQVSDIDDNRFKLTLENYALGKIKGKGLISDKTIAWEIKDPAIGFEGFEFYHVRGQDQYFLHAEYMTGDTQKTEIQGRIWLESTQREKEQK